MDPRVITTAREIERSLPALTEAVADSPGGIEGITPVEHARFLAALRIARAELKAAEKRPGVLSTPQNQLGSLLQSMMVENATAHRPLPDGSLEAQFDSGDWVGWATVLYHKLVDGRKKFAWQKAPAEPETVAQFGDDATIAVFGDWGTGLYGAPVIAETIRTKITAGFVMHLGDVYYSGTKDEYASRFSQFWPTRAGALNRALNGNHEMYCGGRPYFDVLQLAPFHQEATYFAYQNENWILAGLDTAYQDHDITDDQAGWLKQIVAGKGERKVVLFSHHQPFSLLDNQGPKLVEKLGSLLSAGSIFAWYWGHEHECVLYDLHPAWNMYGRCVGHAGMPEFRKDPMGPPVPTRQLRRFARSNEAPSSRVLDGPNPYILGQETQFSPHGFITLHFHGKHLTESILDPDGTVFETIGLL